MAKQGDTFKITVADDLKDDSLALVTSVVSIISLALITRAYDNQHWHGFFQRKSNEMDGVASVNQCPITPGVSLCFAFRS